MYRLSFFFFLLTVFSATPQSFSPVDTRFFIEEFEIEPEEGSKSSLLFSKPERKEEKQEEVFLVFFDQNPEVEEIHLKEKVSEEEKVLSPKKREEQNSSLNKNLKEQNSSSSDFFAPAFNRTFFSADSFENREKKVGNVELVAPNLVGLALAHPPLTSSSSSLFRVSSPHYMSGLFVSNHSLQEERRIPLFPGEMIQNMSNILNHEIGEEISRDLGIIWGYVTDEKGNALEGAQVELNDSGEFFPFYFSSFIPDSKRVETSKNGEFAFFNLPIGTWNVRFSYKGEHFPAQIVPVEKEHISYVHLQKGRVRTFFFKVQEAFNPSSTPSSVVFRTLGEEDFVNLDSALDQEVQMRQRQGSLTWVDADPGEEYELSRYSLHEEQSNVLLPVIQKKWTSNFAEKKEVPIDPEKGIVVGFVERQNYSVRTRSSFLDAQVFYFDRQGRALPPHSNKKFGFVLFNLDTDIQEITLVEQRGENEIVIETKVVAPFPPLVNIIKYGNI